MTATIKWGAAQPLTVSRNGFQVYTSDLIKRIYRISSPDGNTLEFRKSLDHGASWTPDNLSPGVSVTNITGYIPLDEPFCRDAVTGRLHAIYATQELVAGQSTRLWHNWSDDDGASWTHEHQIDDGTLFGTDTQPRVGMAADNGTVVITLMEGGSGGSASAQFRSTSAQGSGASFTRTQPLQSVAEAPGNGQQRPVMKFDNGVLHATWIDVNGGDGSVSGSVWYARSTDMGATWTTKKLATKAQLGGTGGGRSHVHASGGKVNIAVMAPFGNLINSSVYILHSDDNGLNFGVPIVRGAAPNPPGYTHPAVGGIGLYHWCVWTSNGSPMTLMEIHTTDGGTTWSTPTVIQTYSSSNNADAPWIIPTSKVMAAAYTETDAFNSFMTRLPAFMAIPDVTRVLDDCTRADDLTPPPTGTAGHGQYWAGTAGNGATTNGGLVIQSNRLKRSSASDFRQGGYWNNDIGSDDHEFGLRIAALPGAGDHFDIYARADGMDGTPTMYGLSVDHDSGNVGVNRFLNGAYQATPFLGNLFSRLGVGDNVFVQPVGTSIRIWLNKTGTEVWELLGNAEDANVTAGRYAGLDITNSQVFQIDRWYGGTVVDPSISPSGGNPVYQSGATVTGTPSVGQTLTANPGLWIPTPSNYTYRWQQADDGAGTNTVDLPNGAARTFVLTPAQQGKYIRCGILGNP